MPARLREAARFQGDPRYADRVYGRVVRGGPDAVLQYWLMFYGSPLVADGALWRLLQVELGDERGRLVAANTEPTRRARRVPAVAPYDGAGAPEVFVSPLTQNLFFAAGDHVISTFRDRVNPAPGDPVELSLEELGDWALWQGHWGSPDSVVARSPSLHPAWSNHRTASTRARPKLSPEPAIRRVRGRNRRLPAKPSINARLDARGAVLQRPPDTTELGWYVTLHDDDGTVLSGTYSWLRGQQLGVHVPPGVTRCEVRLSLTTDSGRRSESVSRTIAADEPDTLESAILERVAQERLRGPEISKFIARLGVTEAELIGALERPAAAAAQSVDPHATPWSRVVEDLQAFREARFDDTALADLRQEQARRIRRGLWKLAALVVLILVPVCLYLLVGSAAAGVSLVVLYLPMVALAAQSAVLWATVALSRRHIREFEPGPGAPGDPLTKAREAFERALAEKAVAPILRERLNAATIDSYDEPLDFGDEGLTELRIADYEVPTAARRRLLQLTERMRGGSIGIAGSRGVGKTTLIRSFCTPRSTSDRRLTTILAAPTRYDARDFVLTLFGQLCTQALAGADPPPARPEAAIVRGRYIGAALLLAGGAAACAASSQPADNSWKEAALLLFGIALGTAAPFVFFRLSLAHAAKAVVSASATAALAWTALDLPIATWLAIALGMLAAVATVGLALWALRLRGARPPRVGASPSEQLERLARDSLRDIRFEQTFSRGYSGKLAVPFGGELSAEQKDELAQRQATFPELVERLREFLLLAAQVRGQVAIGIDEMDKMESGEAAEQFLNEIKGVFGVDGVFFLVSISEDAMSAFERRGLPFRDVFDSSFDEVVLVRPLPLKQSKLLLRSRVLGLGPPYLDLCHALSGGLARDVLRVARRLSLLNGHELPLAEVCAELVREDLLRQEEAAVVAVRRVGLEPQGNALLAWMRDLREQGTDAEGLLRLCCLLPEEWGAPAGSSEPWSAQMAELQRIALEAAAYAYLLATILELFASDQPDPAGWFRDAERGEDDECSLFDRLGEARRSFATSPHLALRLIDRVRDDVWPDRPPAGTMRFARVPSRPSREAAR